MSCFLIVRPHGQSTLDLHRIIASGLFAMAKGKSSNKGSLKSALQSQQHRLQKKAHAKHAAEVTEQQRKGGHQKHKRDKGKARDIVPFAATDRILLVGEGNFSFARALVQRTVLPTRTAPPYVTRVLLSPGSVTATAYDSEEECYEKYPDAHEIVRELREKGAEVVFGVDATKLDKHPALKGRRWDRVVWNFPHAGASSLFPCLSDHITYLTFAITGKGIADQDRNILVNQLLILGFLRTAEHLLVQGVVPVVVEKKKAKPKDDEDDEEPVEEPENSVAKPTRGTVLITLRNVAPYTHWYAVSTPHALFHLT